MGFRRGFKAEAERLALSTRAELRLGAYARLRPLQLAEHLAIPVLTLGDLSRLASTMPGLDAATLLLRGSESSALSAVTVFRGSERVIVHNDAHSDARQASDVSHELAHGLLLHPPMPALNGLGCRDWKGDLEDEASFLGGALLVPSKAAWWIAKRGLSLEQAAEDYGCSVEMVRWRINVTGARRLMVAK